MGEFEILKEKKKESLLLDCQRHTNTCQKSGGGGGEKEREREREVLSEAVAGNNGKLSDGEAFNGALTALCW